MSTKVTQDEAKQWFETARHLHSQLVMSGKWHVTRDNQGVLFAGQCLCRDKDKSLAYHFSPTPSD